MQEVLSGSENTHRLSQCLRLPGTSFQKFRESPDLQSLEAD